MSAVRPLPIVGGHVALDFANTVDDPLGPQRWDHIADYEGLLTWAQTVDVVPAAAVAKLRGRASRQPRRSAGTARRAAELRSVLNETFGAVLDGRSVEAVSTRLRPYVAEALAQVTVSVDDREAQLNWEFTEFDSVLWPLAESAYRLLVGPELPRLKRCAGCPWLFLDYSKNRSRRWCSMEDCGTHEKIRRYVSKRASTRVSRR